ncbi:Calx-beta domain-containing protein [Limnoglobus roseus]|uniref:Calx-beta domain protein n=1 Tax=Limnoglobus roseus TaxID=2598579 RepID=A0A5C1AEF5_9BACT|nr:Calx-beta domain-containing protein [Limnoglobus roseus]QEL17641.1 Calx-beta domain protein [Limnoglobus roseus]
MSRSSRKLGSNRRIAKGRRPASPFAEFMGGLEERLTPAFSPTGLLSPTAAGTEAVAEVAAGTRLASVNTGDSALLNGLLTNLTGTGSGVSLSAVDYSGLVGGEVNLGSVLDNLRAQLSLATPEQALTANVNLSQLLTAAATAAQADGNVAVASSLGTLATNLGSLTGTVRLGDMFNIDLPAGGYNQASVNALDLLTGGVQLFNFQNVVATTAPVSLSGGVLGLGGVLNSVSLQAVVVEPPVFAVGPAGTQFSSAGVRLKLDVDLVDLNPNTSGLVAALSGLGNVTASLTLGQIQLYADIARGAGTIQAIDSISSAVTIRSTPGVANVYLGDVSDALLFNRSHAINPAADIGFGTVGSLNLRVAVPIIGTVLANVSAGVTVRSTALGVAAAPALNTFFAPFPGSATVGAGSGVVANFLSSLTAYLQVALSGSLGALLNPLVNGTILPIVQPIVGGALSPVLGTVLTGVVDPALSALGVGIGEMDVAVLGADLPDDVPTVSVGDVTAAEGNGGTAASFTVTLSAASTRTVTVNYATADGTATAGSDYAAAGGTVTFAPGETSKTITVAIVGDTTDEPDETFSVHLTGATNAAVATAVGTATLTDDDPPPAVSVGNTAAAENAGLPPVMTFTVTLSEASAKTVTVNYATADGTALAVVDYVPTSGTLTFLPGETSRTVTVFLIGDTLIESDESFTLTLSGPSNATLGTATGTGTIVNDDTGVAVAVSPAAVAEDAATGMAFTLTRTGVTAGPLTVVFTAGGLAAFGVDYAVSGADSFTAGLGTVTFAPGSATAVVTVTPTADGVVELNETVSLTVLPGIGYQPTGVAATGTIVNDDTPGVLVVQSGGTTAVTEGGAADTLAVSLTSQPLTAVTITLSTGSRITAGPAVLTFTPANWNVPQAVTVTAVDNNVYAGPAADAVAFTVLSTDPSYLAVTAASVPVAVTDNETVPTVSVGNATAVEGGVALFTISLSHPSETAVTVRVSTADGTATAGVDYLPVANQLVAIPAGQTAATFAVAVPGDGQYELTEAFSLALSSPTGATLGTATGTGTITDDDPVPTLSIAGATVNEATGTVTLTVTRFGASNVATTLSYTTADGTAVATGPGVGRPDYAATSGTLSFGPSAGADTRTITIPLVNDAVREGTERFFVNLSNATGATVANGQAVVNVIDDDPLPNLSVANVVTTEGAGSVTFTVTLTGATDSPVTVAYATADGTAVATSLLGTPDYVATSGVLTFNPAAAGMQTLTVTVPLVADPTREPTEAFSLSLFAPTNATLGAATATATVADDDNAPTVSVGNGTVAESTDGPAVLTFTVTLSAVSEETVTVDYATVDGTALADSDYEAARGTLTFLPGETTKTVTVSVYGDFEDEAAETLALTLSNPTNVTLGTATGTGTITDDDAAPVVTIANASAAEGNGGSVAITFTVRLSAPSGQMVTVDYATADGTALAGSDYTAASGTLTFAPGEVSKTLTVTVRGDALNEGAESFRVNLGSPTNATVGAASATGTIQNDDPPPSVSVAAATATEGDVGTAVMTFTVTLSAASGQTVTVNYATADGTAAAGSDYTATSGTLTFAPGETSKTVSVTVRADALNEANETLALTLSGPTNATLGAATAAGTILDNDPRPTATVGAVTAVEGTTAAFTVTLSAPSGQTVTVGYATTDGTARAGSRYTAAAGTLTFAPGETSKVVPVSIAASAAAEADGTFTLTLGNPTNATLGAAAMATGTIVSDDVPTGGADSYPATEGRPLVVAAPGVLANDVTGTVGRVELVAGPLHGTLALSPNGGFTYTPAADYNGPDAFTYRAINSNGPSAPVTVALSVAAVNDALRVTAGPDVSVPFAGGPQTVANWLTGTTDESGLPLTITVTADNPALFAVQPSIDSATGTLTFTPAPLASGTTGVTVTVNDGSTVQTETFRVTIAVPSRVNQNQFALVAVGSGPGRDDGVTVYTPDGKVAFSVAGDGQPGGTRAAVGDLDGDGSADVATVGGPGRAAVVSFVSGATGETMRTVTPFESSFKGGAFVAAADVNGDGAADVAVSADTTGGPRVVLYDGRTGDVMANFYGIADAAFRGGARVAFGDVNGDGINDLIVAAGTGGGPRVAVWDGASLRPGGTPTRLAPDFFAFEPTLRDGVFVAAGDVNGDGRADIIVGGGPSGSPRVQIFDGAALTAPQPTISVVANFFAADPSIRAGARVTAKDVDGDALIDVVVGVPSASGAVVKTYLGKDLRPGVTPSAQATFAPFADELTGVYVG